MAERERERSGFEELEKELIAEGCRNSERWSTEDFMHRVHMYYCFHTDSNIVSDK